MSRSLVYLLALNGCWLIACPAAHNTDAGVVASDAHTPDAIAIDALPVDASALDASLLVDAHTVDAALDAPEHDAFHHDAASDAFTCSCDDGIACTFDGCDPSGACVHWSMCASNEACLPSGACAPSEPCTTSADCLVNQPCQELLGCMRGRCAYRWNVDRDGDGALDMGCGGNDCAPSDRTIPRAETCNNNDDDCNGLVDDIAGADTDPLNCGGCHNSCPARRLEICIAGECACTAEHARCAERSFPVFAPDGCYDLQTDALHCGSCDLACPEGSTCEAGLCRYRATWMHGVDATVPLHTRGVLVAPNGDVLFEVFGRPTQLFHQGRSPDPIPPGASPFARHIVRLDLDGNLIGVTSIPDVVAGEWSLGVLRRTLRLAVTDSGFYFAGNVSSDVEVLGVQYTRTGAPVIGYVPRATSAIAWAQPFLAQAVLGTAGTREGILVLLAYRPGDARPWESVALRRFGTDGMELPHDTRHDVYFFNSARTVFPSRAGGFIVPNQYFPMIPGIATYGDRRESAALIFDAGGMLQEAVAIGSIADHMIFDERPDANAWLVRPYEYQEHSRTAPRRSLGSSSRYGPFASFDESGVAAVNGEGLASQLERFRDARMVETVTLPAIAYLEEGSAWLLNSSDSDRTRAFSLPGATTTLSRVDLPPIP